MEGFGSLEHSAALTPDQSISQNEILLHELTQKKQVYTYFVFPVANTIIRIRIE